VRLHEKLSDSLSDGGIFMKILLALSPLELHFLSELIVFMFAHFLLAPLLYVSHAFTSSMKNKSEK